MSSEEVGADLCPIMVEIWFIRDKSAEAVETLGCDRQVAALSFLTSPSCLRQTGIWRHRQSLDDLAEAREKNLYLPTQHCHLHVSVPSLGWAGMDSEGINKIFTNIGAF